MPNVDPDPAIVDLVNQPAESRFQLEVERDAENMRFAQEVAALTKKHDNILHGFAVRERELDAALWENIKAHESELIDPKKRSFASLTTIFKLKNIPPRTELVDKKAIMEKARELRIVRKIARIKVEWTLVSKKFLEWLDKHGEHRKDFEPFLEYIEADESLTIQPNGNYTVLHDSQRISPPSITIKKPEKS